MKSVQTVLTESSSSTLKYNNHYDKAIVGHYINKHTKKILKKRKLNQDESQHESATFTYNILYIPRILKNDLRRQYPVMFMNVFNACNYDYMMNFLDKFFHNDCKFVLDAPSK